MSNSIDFRSNQIQTGRLIVASGSGQSSNCLVVYGINVEGSPANQGIIDPTQFNTMSIGTDTFFFVSGTVGDRGTINPTVSVFGGDVHISGNLTIDGTGGGGGVNYFENTSGTTITSSGSLYLSGGLGATFLSSSFGGDITGSFTQGDLNIASGYASHAEGGLTFAAGDYSHAEGGLTFAGDMASHSEGYNTFAYGGGAHAEGTATTASGSYSHAEGLMTITSGAYSHAEGDTTIVVGDWSHAEGRYTITTGSYSHAEGESTITNNNGSHSEGLSTVTYGDYAHAEGESSQAVGRSSHSEGKSTYANGDWSHAEGEGASANNLGDHAEGYYTRAQGFYSHVEGEGTLASAWGSHAEGFYTTASADYAHAEGSTTQATGNYSHAEGSSSFSIGLYSHAEGTATEASGYSSHTEGTGSVAYGDYSHASGIGTIAFGTGSYAAGLSTIASGAVDGGAPTTTQAVFGKYNKRANTDSLFVVGDGSGDTAAGRHDILRVNSGSVDITGSLIATGITGSISGTVGGLPFIVAGSNVTASYNGSGQWTIAANAGGGGGDTYWTSTVNNAINTTGSAAATVLYASAGANITGSLIATGITGSISGTVGGLPFIVAGTNTTAVYNGSGQWTLTAFPGDGYPAIPSLDSGNGWEAVAATSVNVGTANISFLGSGVARLAGATTGDMHDLSGPRLERPLPITFDPLKQLRVSFKVVARTNTAGIIYAVLYIRDGVSGGTYTGTNVNGVACQANGEYIFADIWIKGSTGVYGNMAGVGGLVAMTYQTFGLIYMGATRPTTGAFVLTKQEALGFIPTYFGVAVAADGPADGHIDISDLTISQV